ncbi:MAG: TonB family protein [Ignavibacteria bacterium]|nr:MAG: TonB family protein [Ignavibacteria bacterium]KAF0158305.1 MAG: TonB family protein [Ignavibacteria bacterium]
MFFLNFDPKLENKLHCYKIALFLCALSLSFISAQNGIVKSYYPNRAIKSELSFVNDILDGTVRYYHENGNIKLEQNFSRGILNGWIKEYYANGNLKEVFFVKDGVLDRDKKLYAENGQLYELITYNNGVASVRKIFETDQVISDVQIKTDEKIQHVKQDVVKEDNIKLAFPIGGIEAVQSKIVYPEHALKYGLEGMVELVVTVDETGTPIKTLVKKGIGLGCDEAAINAVMKSRFYASIKNDTPVLSETPIALEFKLPKLKDEPVIAKYETKSEAAKPERKFEEHLSVICEADRCPRPDDDLATIYSRFEIPTVAKALKLRGMIIIEGFVDKDGNLKQTKIIDGIGYGCDQLVENSLVKSKFNPALKKGEPVEAKIVLSFPFSYATER